MRDETTAPKGSSNRVKVFISSRCEMKEKYGTFRRALKKLLTESNLCDVFIFEDGASTQTAEEYYQTHIPQSDVVIFFVDNDDEKKNLKKRKALPDGILREYIEAKRQGKKHLFFYSGNDKNKTELQKEIEKDSGAPKWLKIDDFTKAADEIYESVINDILMIYKNYCAGRLISTAYISKENNEPISESSAVDMVSSEHIIKTSAFTIMQDIKLAPKKALLSKIDFNQFSKTYAVLAKILRCETPNGFKRDYNEPLQTSALDTVVAPLLAYIIGHGTRETIDFTGLKEHVTALHDGIMVDFVARRIDIIEKYINSEAFDELRSSINDVYSFARANQLSDWLLFDVLIDNRNINAMTSERMWFEEQNWAKQEMVQEQLNETSGNYYPEIDRLEASLYNKCLDVQFKQKTMRLGARSYGERLWGMYDLVKTFIVAVSNGSLFHTFHTANKLEKLLYSYMSRYSNREYYIEYVRIKLIAMNRLKDLEAAISERIWNDFNALEAKSIWNSICTFPEYHSKAIIKYRSLKLLWDYMDDELFSHASQWLLELYKKSICNREDKVFNSGDEEEFLETLAAIAPRLTKEAQYFIITTTPISLWSHHSARWLFKTWSRVLDNNTCDSNELVHFSEMLVAIHEANVVERNNADFLNVAIRLLLCNKMNDKERSLFRTFLDENYPELSRDYTNDDLDWRLTLRLDILEESRQTPVRSSDDIIPLIEILKIITSTDYNEMPSALAERMYTITISTVYSENEYIADNERVAALKIIMALAGRFKIDREQLIRDTTALPQTLGNDWPFSISAPKAIIAGLNLLKASLGTMRPAELALFISSIQDDINVHTTIDIIRYWVRYNGKNTKTAYVDVMLQYVVSQLIGNSRGAIRKIACLLLVELSETRYDKLALDLISQIIDTGVAEASVEDSAGVSFADKATKEVIVSALRQFKQKNSKQVNYILSKAHVDTSWSVRNAAMKVETRAYIEAK